MKLYIILEKEARAIGTKKIQRSITHEHNHIIDSEEVPVLYKTLMAIGRCRLDEKGGEIYVDKNGWNDVHKGDIIIKDGKKAEIAIRRIDRWFYNTDEIAFYCY